MWRPQKSISICTNKNFSNLEKQPGEAFEVLRGLLFLTFFVLRPQIVSSLGDNDLDEEGDSL